ncbi:MAG TPA: alpha/beta fold hydrolase [Hyphomicrobiaceae bacterium]|nr:alpha/beta fold hydrolase [Hyphomicrobiaceae bacterium]
MPAGPDVSHGYADLGDVLLHYVTAGEGSPVVLLHGWPQTWWEWRHVIPRLAQRYKVIAPDLRGLGDSSRPLGGYDKRTVANDVWRLVCERLGHASFFLVGHDWGGPTAYALAVAHPEAVLRLVILDVVIPGSGGDFSQGGRRWHHQFHMTPDLPEALTQGREDIYLSWFYRTFAYRHDAIGPDDLAEYLRTYREPGAMRAGFAYYRAISQDAADNRASIERAKLPMPVMAMGGGVSYPHGRGRGEEPEQSLRRVAIDRARRGRSRMRALHSGGSTRLARRPAAGVLRRARDVARFNLP